MSSSTLLVRLVLTVVAVATVAGCGSSGRELRAPEPGQTAPPRKPSAAGAVSSTSPNELTVFGLASEAWSPGLSIPSRFTCDGLGVSPSFAIFVPPPEAVELALVVTDLDNGLVHWIVTDIAPSTASISQGQLPPGAVEVPNSSGSAAWSGPCPPEGEQHTYEFALYALDTPSAVAAGQDVGAAVAALSAAPLATATITGTYMRDNAQ